MFGMAPFVMLQGKRIKIVDNANNGLPRMGYHEYKFSFRFRY